MATLNVLIPLDGSSFSRRILASVYTFLKPDRHQLILMRVAPPPTGVIGIPPRMVPLDGGAEFIPDYKTASDLELSQHPIYASQVWESLKADISRELNPDVSELQKAGFEVSLLVHFGDAAEEIIQATRQRDIDLVVMATHGRRGLERMLVGSVTEKVLRHSDIPVLMLRPERKEKGPEAKATTNRILIPLDETKFSRTVLKHVIRLLRPSEHHLTLLRVAARPVGEAPVGPEPSIPGVGNVTTDYPEQDEQVRLRLQQELASYYTRLIEDRKAELLKEMEGARALLQDAGFEVELAVRFGRAAEEISDFVTFDDVAMVVMATHSRAGLERLVLGSVAKEVLSRVHVPILMVRPHLDAADETLPQVETRLVKSPSL